MRNNLIIFLLLLTLSLFETANSTENFNFNVTEIEIKNGGNLFKGIKRGTVTTDDGIELISDTFEFNKSTNILTANGNVVIDDKVKGLKLFGNELIYFKNIEVIKSTERGTVTTDDGIELISDTFEFNKSTNILTANGNVVIDDKVKGLKLFGNELIYFKNKELIIGKNGFKAIDKTSEIEGEQFEYQKNLEVLNAKNNVKITNKIDDYIIFSEDVTYFKNKELIIGKNGFKAIDKTSEIEGEKFEYQKNLEILNAKNNVKITNTIDDYIIYSEDITYFKEKGKFFSKYKTKAIIQSEYEFNSRDVTFLKQENKIFSQNKSTLIDNKKNFYSFKNFEYLLNDKILKGNHAFLISNYNQPKSDKTFFSSAIFNFNSKKFNGKDTKISLHRELFDSERKIKENTKDIEKKKIERFKAKNEPRIYGLSASGNDRETIIKKGIFTTCQKNDDCPPWSMSAKKITHDKIKRNIIYDDAVLNIFDFPVFYFPKFFHPDPSVERRSGLLQPKLNKSNIVGSSITLPYFKVLSDNKDLTIKPTVFDDRIYMLQNEYRQKNENSSFIADFGFTKGYKSSLSENRNSMSHLFSKYNLNLNLEEYDNSKLDIFLEKVSMDTYLKIFENVLITDKTLEQDLKDHNTMTSGAKLTLDKYNFNFTAGITSYENLQESKNNDKYQYVLPYFDLSTTLFSNELGSVTLSSSGNNKLTNTNNLRSTVTNNLNFQSTDKYSKYGFVTNYQLYFKNLNAVAKNDEKYKSSPQSEILNINQLNLTYPMLKEDDNVFNYLTPKVSFKINPSDMKNYSADSRLITTDNAFSINRLGFSDSFEAGKSMTLGLDYRKEKKSNSDKYYEVKLATILRDTPDYKLPRSSSLQGKTSNLFGSFENKMNDYLTFNYNFSLDNNLKNFEYNDFNTEFKLDNFETDFRFHESNGKVGDSNYFENETSFNFDENNSLAFKTRRNRKISLTEFYDFVYEYQNDCLTAAIKYRKTYYQDRDAIPKEDLFFSITLFPLATVEQKIDKKIYRDDNNDIIWK